MSLFESLNIDWKLFGAMIGGAVYVAIAIYAGYCFYRHNESLRRKEEKENERMR